MLQPFASFGIFGLCLTLAAAAKTDEMSVFGTVLCQTALAGGLEGVELDHYAAEAEAGGQSRDDFCVCVGQRFTSNAEAQQSRMAAAGEEEAFVLVEILEANMDQCLPEDGEMGGIEVISLDSQFSEAEADPEDIRLCELALVGDFPLMGLRPEDVLDWTSHNGFTSGEICGCSARYIAATPKVRAMIDESSSGKNLGQTIRAGIEECMAGEG